MAPSPGRFKRAGPVALRGVLLGSCVRASDWGRAMRETGLWVRVWDGPIRLFHWGVVVLVFTSWLTQYEGWMQAHEIAGYTMFAALLFRLAWGAVGSDTARFSHFVTSWRAAARHLAQALHREPDRQVGHNPAGGWMVLLLITLLFGETLSGLYVANDVADEGPLTQLTPAPIANAITALACLDPQDEAILAALARSLQDPSPLVRRMALGGLGEIGPAAKAAIPALAKALKDKDENVRKATAEALERIRTK